MDKDDAITPWRKLEPGTDDISSGLLDAPWGSHPPNLLQRLLIGLTQRTLLQRGALRKMMTPAIMSLSRPLDIRFRGCMFRIEGRNNLIERGILTRPRYNAVEIEFLEDAVRDGGVAVDIGCNLGLYSLPLAKASGPSGRVLSIDANAAMIDHLKFNARASGIDNIHALHMAVGAAEARADLEIRKGDTAIVRVEENSAGSTLMMPLLKIVEDAGLQRIDALKIDIEGHEDAAMVPFLQNCSEPLLPARIVIERASATQDYPGCVAEFERLGYQLAGRTRNNSMYQRGYSTLRFK